MEECLPALMLFLSWMMVSEVKYPTFKSLNLRATRTSLRCLCGDLVGSLVVLRGKIVYWVLPLFSRVI